MLLLVVMVVEVGMVEGVEMGVGGEVVRWLGRGGELWVVRAWGGEDGCYLV